MSISIPIAPRPLVSVCLVTYNHERFIAQALDGVLMQQAEFPVEILVADDCSTDSAGQIAREYAGRYPRVRVLDRPKNLGANRNFKAALAECKGKYIAVLDGDDYWTSPAKLQRQVEFLEARPNHVACFHAVMVMQDGAADAPWVYRPAIVREIYQLQDVLRNNEFATCSAMLRRDRVSDLPEWYCQMRVGDWPLYAMMARNGSLGYIDEVMAVYRKHAGGAWTGLDKVGKLKDRVKAYSAMHRFFEGRQGRIIRPILSRTCMQLAREYENQADFIEARRYALQAARLGALKSPELRKTLLRMLLRFTLPALYGMVERRGRKSRTSGHAGNS